MPELSERPSGYLTLTLHAHLPWVVNHGTWPHGMEWLHEAAAETYLPLLAMLRDLARDGVPFQCNLNLSPILLEQLSHPLFRAEFPKYLARKMLAAQEDEAFFNQSGERHYAGLARFWYAFFAQAAEDFRSLGGDILSGFRHFNSTSLIDVMTCCATHGYLPLLGTDESVRAQIRVAVQTHTRHFGTAPRGIWLPECGYRPAGFWSYPVPNQDGSENPGFDRIGVEQTLAEADLGFFFVDTHSVEESRVVHSPYALSEPAHHPESAADRPVYQPYIVAGPYRAEYPPVDIFPRDPRTGLQVWSGELGYPGDANYLDFHKKRWPGGHRYWRVTGPRVDMANKEPYYPDAARDRAQEHARHFVGLVHEALATESHPERVPILSAPFDAELFGHWWFEGVTWLDQVARLLAQPASPTRLISGRDYLDRFPATDPIAMREGSWGAEGGNNVWLNPETRWTWTHIYPAERYTRDLAASTLWRENPTALAIAQQLCRELLLLESSDWQFLITTGAARDYAESRFLTHNDFFSDLRGMWEILLTTGDLSPEQHTRLSEISTRDNIFPDLDPGLWAHTTSATLQRTAERDLPRQSSEQAGSEESIPQPTGAQTRTQSR